MKLRLGVIGIAASILVPSIARAICVVPPSPPVTIYSSLEYLKQQIDGMGWASQALRKINKNFAGPVDALVAYKSAQDDLDCAALRTEPFLKSTDEWISKSATTVSDSYRLMGQALQQMEALISALSRNSERITDEDVATARRDVQRAADVLEQTLSYTGVVVRHRTQPMTLLITRAERVLLKAQLEKEFGPGVKKGLQGCSDGDKACAAGTLVCRMLDRKDVQSSDAKPKAKRGSKP